MTGEIGQLALYFGANDMGSLMIEETVVASAGTIFGPWVTQDDWMLGTLSR